MFVGAAGVVMVVFLTLVAVVELLLVVALVPSEVEELVLTCLAPSRESKVEVLILSHVEELFKITFGKSPGVMMRSKFVAKEELASTDIGIEVVAGKGVGWLGGGGNGGTICPGASEGASMAAEVAMIVAPGACMGASGGVTNAGDGVVVVTPIIAVCGAVGGGAGNVTGRKTVPFRAVSVAMMPIATFCPKPEKSPIMKLSYHFYPLIVIPANDLTYI